MSEDDFISVLLLVIFTTEQGIYKTKTSIRQQVHTSQLFVKITKYRHECDNPFEYYNSEKENNTIHLRGLTIKCFLTAYKEKKIIWLKLINVALMMS